MASAQRRQQKKLRSRQQECRKQVKLLAERGRVKYFLTHIGLWDDIKKLGLKKWLPSHRRPRLKILRSAETLRTAKLDRIVTELQQALNETQVDLPSLDYSVSVQEFVSLLAPVIELLHYGRADEPLLTAFLNKAKERIAPFASNVTEELLLLAIVNRLDDVLLKYGRIDTALFYVSMHTAGDPYRNWLEVHQEKARRVKITVDGKARPAYRCGQSFFPGSIDWISWDSAKLGLPGNSRHLPVYVQQHAIDRIYGPRGRLGQNEADEPILHDFLWQSLRKPVIHRSSNGRATWLVEYRLYDLKAGYLVAHILADKVLIKTFLFLTMDGTPESNKLRKRLRLRRADKDLLGLDDIRTYMATDLRTDRQLVSLLSDCNCGHLFEVGDTSGPLETGYSQRTRHYLGLSQAEASPGSPATLMKGVTHPP